MNCCAKCFKDLEVSGFITHNSTQVGNCDFCQAENTQIMPAAELYDTFSNLFSSYSIPQEGDEVDPRNLKFIHDHFIDWNLFTITDNAVISGLVSAIGEPIFIEDPLLFTSNVIPSIFLDISYKKQAEQFISLWQNFTDEIKNTNRFFVTNALDLQLLEKVLSPFSKSYHQGKRLYRSRVCDKDGILLENMGKPPAKHATPGRANPKGISYLYLSNDKKTTIYEVRATLYDYIMIAEFKLIENIKIASLRNTDKVSPILLEDINEYLLYKEFIMLLESALMKPLRRHDSELDYLPTQYLCEFIKSLGYAGIEYSSSLNTEGFNIALFDDDKVECLNATMYEVGNIDYAYTEFVE